MPRPLLYLDECVDHGIVPLLTLRGLAVTTARSAGILGATDRAQLAYTEQHNRLIVTHNMRDFRRLHQQGMRHAGMFLIPVGEIELLDIRIALFADWVAMRGDYRSQLFRWHDVQQWLIGGERVPGYTESEVRRAVGHMP